jgi:spore coat polysaccharide biosynthesis protein SpsF
MSVWAVLACRARSERLYCKPLQRIGGMPILDHVIDNIRRIRAVDGIVLAIADGRENECFIQFAEERALPFVLGSEEDVLARVLIAVERFQIDTMFRVTTECPFVFSANAQEIVADHVAADRDFTTILNLPLGTTYELLQRRVLVDMAATGNPRYRAPLSLYVHERQDALRTAGLLPPVDCRRPEVNLAVDHPGQLMFCQRAFDALAGFGTPISVPRLIQYYDANPLVSSLVTSIHEDVFEVKADRTMARVWA